MDTPLLIVLTGPPASGKSTLSRRLAKTLRVPLLSMDELKERLYETIGSGDAVEPKIEAAALALVLSLAATQLAAGVSAILESTFEAGRDEERLWRVAADRGAELVQVHCADEPERLLRRFEERARSGNRHPGHGDRPEDVDEVRARLEAGVWEPLDLPGALVRVDAEEDEDEAARLVLERVRSYEIGAGETASSASRSDAT